MTGSIEALIASLRRRKTECWRMVEVFVINLDAHGVMDMGAELQALDRAIIELEKLK